MRIVILDFAKNAYDPQSILTHPLGGTQSAVIETCIPLAASHAVTLYNASPVPRDFGSLRVRPNTQIKLADLANADWIIFVSTGTEKLLKQMPVRKNGSQLALWAHHDIDQPAVQFLQQPHLRDNFSRFVFVSAWQATRYQTRFQIPPEHTAVIGNCYCARAMAQFSSLTKSLDTPRLIYTSTPFRGLNILADAFTLFAHEHPGASLTVLSGMELYGMHNNTPTEELFARIAHTPGISLLKPDGKIALYKAIAEANIFAYPSTFPETFCIAALESRILGNPLLLTPLGALPEIFPEAEFYDSQNRGELSAETWAAFMSEAWRKILFSQTHAQNLNAVGSKAIREYSPMSVAQRLVKALSSQANT